MIKNLGNQFKLVNLKIVLISQTFIAHCECYASSSKQNLHDVWFNCSLRYYCHFCPMDYVQLYKDDGIGGDRGSYASRPLEFVRSVNPISTIRVDYALHISSYPPHFYLPPPLHIFRPSAIPAVRTFFNERILHPGFIQCTMSCFYFYNAHISMKESSQLK